jgi:hypothetical protein
VLLLLLLTKLLLCVQFTTSEEVGKDLWALATKLTGVTTDDSLA